VATCYVIRSPKTAAKERVKPSGTYFHFYKEGFSNSRAVSIGVKCNSRFFKQIFRAVELAPPFPLPLTGLYTVQGVG
jgi:hypothetical protein